MMIKRLIFIRPGETNWNRQRRQQGWVAVPLNDHGRQQVERLAKFVRNIGIGALYSSDLKRAEQTAQILGERLGFAPVYDSRLRERHIGYWQGLTLEEIREWYAEDFTQLLADMENYQIPGGEARSTVTTRVRAAFDDILAREQVETVAIVSHTTAVRALLGQLIAGIDAYNLELSNLSVTTVMRDEDGTWRIVEPNDVSHLDGIETQSFREPEQNV